MCKFCGGELQYYYDRDYCLVCDADILELRLKEDEHD